MDSSLKAINAGIQGEVLQYFIAFLVPAGIALAPLAVWSVLEYEGLRGQLVSYPWLTTGVALWLLTALGTVLYEVGSLIEIIWLDKRRDRASGGNHNDEWRRYLTLCLDPNHIGRGYIGRLVTFLRFELAGMVAFPLCGISFVLCFGVCGAPAWLTALVLTTSVLCTWLVVWAADATHGALSALRSAILEVERPKSVPSDASSGSVT